MRNLKYQELKIFPCVYITTTETLHWILQCSTAYYGVSISLRNFTYLGEEGGSNWALNRRWVFNRGNTISIIVLRTFLGLVALLFH